ncbi:MAG: hypothetical protein DSZ23_04310 [Thermodesulfatator sp.]|nr:MAG: hypothetical protein DSZ23_04310 [Thermodesulfatator sp.]
MFLDLFFWVSGILLLLIVGYLFFLAFAAMVPGDKLETAMPEKSFLILVPAHNEASAIGATLESIRKSEYPENMLDVVVVADNCSDNTAEIVKSMGIQCLERNDPENTGKGHVLAWVFRHIVDTSGRDAFDAFIILDADTHVAEDFFSVMNTRLLNGQHVIQAYTQVRHPERSCLESLAFLGFALNRNLRYLGRTRLGLQANLMGTGMCFARQVIERHGWPALSRVEDLEMTMYLKLRGVRVFLAEDAHATVELHENVHRSGIQRLRWDIGKFQVRNMYLSKFIKRFFQTGDFSFLDSSLELVLPPFSLFFALVMALFAFYLFVDFRQTDMLFYVWTAIIFLLFIYIFLGMWSAHANFKVYRALLCAPFFVLWRLWIIMAGYVRKYPKTAW